MKKNRIFFISLLLLLILLSFGSGPLAAYLVSEESSLVKSTSNDWIGFLGSFLGGIVGGLFTLTGVIIAFKLEKDNQILSRLPQKISELNRIENLINDHKFSDYVKKTKFKNLSLKEIRILYTKDLNQFKKEINTMLAIEEDIIKIASSINTIVFVALQNYFKSLHVINKYSNDYLSGTINNAQEVQKNYTEILQAIKFHLDTSKTTQSILKEEREGFLNLLHGQKNARYIDDQYKHEYLGKFLYDKK